MISVVIPLYNYVAFLPAALSSIRAQVQPVHEIILVDDGSTDEAVATMLRTLGPEISVLRRPNGGPAAARNTGLEHAGGDLIAFLDADDLWAPDALQTLASALAEARGIEIARGRSLVIDAHGDVKTDIAPFHSPLIGAALYRRDVFDRIGGFTEELRLGEDIDYSMRERERGAQIRRVDHVVHYYRRHLHGVTAGRSLHTLGVLDAVKRSLDRRRTGRPPG